MKKIRAAVAPSLCAAAALILTTSLIAEISAEPTWGPGIQSSTWTPATAVTALFFGHSAFHGDFAPPSILFGWLVIAVVSLIAGTLATAFIVYCLGRHPHPLAAALLGAAWGLAMEIVLINLLCNWLQEENGIYESMPSWGWWVGMGAWGVTLGLVLSRSGRRSRLEGAGVRVDGPSPLLSVDPHPGAPHPTPGPSPILSGEPSLGAPHTEATR